MTISSAVCSASRTSGVRLAVSAPRNSTPVTGPFARSRIMNSWKACQPSAVLHEGAYGLVAHRQHLRGDVQRVALLVDRLGQPRPLAQAPGAAQADGQVAVAEVEPDVLAQLAQAVHHVERVVR